MSRSLGRVLVVTTKAPMAIRCHSILGRFDSTAYSVSPVFIPEPPSEDSRLVILDADSVPDWVDTVRAESAASHQLFVILSRNVSPRLVHDALTAGVRGLLSSALSTEEVAHALSQVRRGLCTFRFEPQPDLSKTAAAAPPKTPRTSKRRARWSCVCLD